MYVNCRVVNNITVKYRHPISRLDDMLDELHGSSIFSKIDFKSGYDMIRAMKKQLNSDSDVKCTTIQFHGNSYNSQSNRWIELNFYVESPDRFSYHGLKLQVNQSLGRHHNTDQQRLHEFCYLLSFDLCTSYLVRVLFLQECGSLFWKSPSSTRIFNGLQHSLQVWQGFIILFSQGFLIHPTYNKKRRFQNYFYLQIRFSSLYGTSKGQ
jgi:hypothetical protein